MKEQKDISVDINNNQRRKLDVLMARAILQHIYERELITKRTMAAINRDCEKIIKEKT